MVELKLCLREEDVELLVKLRDFIDSLIETVEVMSDDELLREIEEALEDVKKGRLISWNEFLT
mgnify:CR=1 FL=1